MRAITHHSGIAVPLRASDVDTDQIIPARFVVGVTRTGYEDALMHDWRRADDFVLNAPQHQGGSILLAGPNFGTGSSRESAVWALMNYGFEVVVAPSFGDIFRGNATNNGLATATIGTDDLRSLWEQVETAPRALCTVDLEHGRLTHDGLVVDIDVRPEDYHRLSLGLDDIELTLQVGGAVDAYEATRRGTLPSTAASTR